MTPPDVEAVRCAIADGRRNLIDRIDVFDSIDSTNNWLMQGTPPGKGRFNVALARQQTAGRGRRGRHWLSPPGAGLFLSVSWTTATSLDQMAGTTLVIGACVAGALDDIGVAGVELKWPNDIMLNDGKLGGILTESKSSSAGLLTIVTGIGINVDMSALPADAMESLAVPVVDLASAMTHVPDIVALAGTVTTSIIEGLCHVEVGSTDTYLDRWMARDWLRGRSVVVDVDGASLRGVCHGVDNTGALLLDSGGTEQRIVAGSVQLSPAGRCTG